MEKEKLYHVLTVINGIVEWEVGDVSQRAVDTVTKTFPYRRDEDMGNPVARVKRQCEHIMKRGYTGTLKCLKSDPVSLAPRTTSAEMVIVDTSKDDCGRCLFYMFKAYKDGKFLPNPNMTEQERITRAQEYYAEQSLPLGRGRWDYRHFPYSVVKDYMTEDEFNIMFSKLHAFEDFSPEEHQRYLNLFMSMPEELSVRMRFKFASEHSSRVASAGSGYVSSSVLKKDPNAYYPSDYPAPTLEGMRSRSNDYFFWIDTLRGTKYENYALSCKAEMLCQICKEDDATDLYKNVLEKSTLTAEERTNIQDKVKYLGYGRRLHDKMAEQKTNHQYDIVLKLFNEWKEMPECSVKRHLNYRVIQIWKDAMQKLGKM